MCVVVHETATNSSLMMCSMKCECLGIISAALSGYGKCHPLGEQICMIKPRAPWLHLGHLLDFRHHMIVHMTRGNGLQLWSVQAVVFKLLKYIRFLRMTPLVMHGKKGVKIFLPRLFKF